MKILVTPRSVTRTGHPSLQALVDAGYQMVFSTPGQQPGEEELRTLLTDCTGYIAGVEPISAQVLEAAPRLRVISRNGTGTDNVDLAVAKRLGIEVLRAEGANARGVAELAIAQVFNLARACPAHDASLKSGTWHRPSAGIELEERTLGIVGCGRIGKLVARMALGIGMRVLAFDQFPDSNFQPAMEFQYAPLEDVLSSADFLSLHCPPNRDGRPVLDHEAIRKLKPGCRVINTARYDVIDPEAVLAALETGHLGGLALDVFDAEPPYDWRLVNHPRVLASPHVGGFTQESIDRAMSQAVENLLTALGSPTTKTRLAPPQP